MEQQKVKERIGQLLRSDRFPGAAVFAGPEASGKKEAALGVARYLNCGSPRKERGEACGTCLSCSKIEPGGDIRHLDVALIRPEGRWFKIEQVRRMRHEIYFRPYEGRKRIFILDQADKMTRESANALLKVLEEPPAHAHLMLVCSSFLALLPTIRSRCLLFRFGAMPMDTILASLEEAHDLDSSRARVAASLIRANQLQLKGFNWDEFALVRDRILMLLNAALVKKDPLMLLDGLDFVSLHREDLDDSTKMLITLLRDMLAERCGSSRDLAIHQDIFEELGALAEGFHRADISVFFEKALRTEKNFTRNVNKKLAFDSLFLGFYRYSRDRAAGLH
jgi:DNA polymerase-3 subunit delta'